MKRRGFRHSVLLLAIIITITSLPTAVMASETFTLYVSPGTTTDDNEARAEGATYQTLQGAISHAEDGDRLVVKENLILSEVITIPDNLKNLVIKGDSADVTVKRADDYTGAMLKISNDADVTLQNIIVDGGAVWSPANNYYERTNSGVEALDSCIKVDGTLSLGNGAQVQNNDYVENITQYGRETGGAAISVTKTGSLTLAGIAKLHDNACKRENKPPTDYGGNFGGGAIAVNGGKILIEDDVEIYHNFVDNQNGAGGAIVIRDQATVTMNGGKIYENMAFNGGGIGTFYNGGHFILNEGVISDNTARMMGGGVRVCGIGGTSTFTMNGGTISGNSVAHNTDGSGGGVHLYGGKDTFIMTDGVIENNFAQSSGGGIAVGSMSSPSSAVILDGSIRNNRVSKRLGFEGDGIACSGKLYLNGKTADIEGDIHLRNPSSVIDLIGASDTMNNYLISTFGTAADGRVVVKPAQYSYGGTTYAVEDTEPYVEYFSHISKRVIKGSEYNPSPSPKNLVLFGTIMRISFDMNRPSGVTVPTNPEFLPAIIAEPNQVIMDLPDFPEDPTLDGYQFDGWYTSKLLVLPSKVTDATETGRSDMTLYAKWKIPAAKVTFLVGDEDKGEMNPDEATWEVNLNTTVNSKGKRVPTVTGKIGWRFIGWKDDIHEGLYDSIAAANYLVTEDVVFTAQYVEADHAVVIFDFNGGTSGTSSHIYLSGQSGTTYIEPEAPTKDGYLFVGWTPTPDGIFGAEGSTTTYTAQYEENTNAVVFFDYNGGSAEGRSSSYVSGQPGSAYQVPVPTKEGYTFKEWSPSTPSGTFTGAGVVEAYIAQWTPIENMKPFLVTFDPGTDGTITGNAEEEVAYGEFVKNVPSVTANSEHVFVGWGNNTEIYNEAAVKVYPITEDVVFTAQYAKTIDAVVIFDYNGGLAEGRGSSFGSGQPGSSYEVPVPEKEGYFFKEWSPSTPTGIFGDTGVIEEYIAQWTPKENKEVFFVTFDNGEYGAMNPETHSENVTSGEAVKLVPQITVNSGYTFLGWTLNNGSIHYSAEEVKNMPITENSLFLAMYEKISTGGGKGGGSKNIPDEKPPLSLLKEDHIAYVKGYPEGDFRPERSITRAEAAQLFYNLLIDVEKTGYTSRFADVKSSAWYSDAVNCLTANGVIQGYPDGSFRPDHPITRAEFATLSSKFDKLSLSERNRFADVQDGHWAVSYINSAAVKGWIKGYENGEFRPERNITRAEVVTLVNAILERKVSLSEILKEAKGFTDLTSTHWAYCDIMEAANAHNYSRKTDSLYEIWHNIVK